MVYSIAKLKSNDDRTSPCFKPFLIGNMSDKFLHARTQLYFSVRHIFISLTRFKGIPKKLNASIIQDLPPNWIISFLEVYKDLMHCFVVFPFFSSIWRMQNIWSVVELLHRNPHWWSPTVSSAYGINLDSRILDKILYVVDKSDLPV